MSELQVGDRKLRLPGPVTYDAPFHRVIHPTTIPDMRDDIVNGSFGFKFQLPNAFTVVANALVPLNRGGMRPNLIYTTASSTRSSRGAVRAISAPRRASSRPSRRSVAEKLTGCRSVRPADVVYS